MTMREDAVKKLLDDCGLGEPHERRRVAPPRGDAVVRRRLLRHRQRIDPAHVVDARRLDGHGGGDARGGSLEQDWIARRPRFKRKRYVYDRMAECDRTPARRSSLSSAVN